MFHDFSEKVCGWSIIHLPLPVLGREAVCFFIIIMGEANNNKEADSFLTANRFGLDFQLSATGC